MKTLDITRAQFEEFKRLQIKKHWRYPIAFGTNSIGEIWPTVTRGRTPEEKRDYVQDLSGLLREVASRYTDLREQSGRLFINYDEAFWMDEADTRHTIVAWNCDVDLRPPQRQITLAKRRAQRSMLEKQKEANPA